MTNYLGTGRIRTVQLIFVILEHKTVQWKLRL